MVIDLVATLFYEAEEKLQVSKDAFDEGKWGDSIYQSYAALISGAKALLLDKQVHVNTHHTLIIDFDKHFVETKEIELPGSFKELTSKISKNHPARDFAVSYYIEAEDFLKKVKTIRANKNVEEIIGAN